MRSLKVYFCSARTPRPSLISAYTFYLNKSRSSAIDQELAGVKLLLTIATVSLENPTISTETDLP